MMRSFYKLLFTLMCFSSLFACGDNTSPDPQNNPPPPDSTFSLNNAVGFLTSADGGGQLYVFDALDPQNSLIEVASEVYEYSWTPSAKEQLAYVTIDPSVEGPLEVYLATLGESPLNLTEEFLDSGGVLLYGGGGTSNTLWSPDGSHLVFMADSDNNGQYELYLADDTGHVSLLNAQEINIRFQWSPDSSQFAYLAGSLAGLNLYLYDLSNPEQPPEKINDDLIAGGSVSFFDWSPDSNSIIYLADQEVVGKKEAYLLDLTASNITKIHPDFPDDREVSGLKFSPDSHWIAYLADQDTLSKDELYIVNTSDLGNSIKVNDDFEDIGDVEDDYAWSPNPNNIYLAYRRDGEPDNDQEFELYVYKHGEGNIKINDDFPSVLPVGMDRAVISFAWSPNGEKIAYLSDIASNDVNQISVSDLISPSSEIDTTVNNPLVEGGVVGSYFQWNPDSSQLLYRASTGKPATYLTSADGTESLKLHQNLIWTQAFRGNPFFSPDGRAVSYSISNNSTDTYDSYLYILESGETINFKSLSSDFEFVDNITFSPHDWAESN
ncbi:MAG: PD40 domain-containing protein [Deltaproteobacteria bacterium]|nr:PD40 domain-containing protein [Deltaproteobacteria bacterium]